MVFINIALKKDIPKGRTKLVEINGNQILIINLNDEYYAIGDKCTHRGCKLSNGLIEGDTIKCGCHKSVFDIKTGAIVHGPATKPLPKYGLNIEKDQIQISA